MLAAMGVAGLVAVAWMSRSLVKTVSGVEEAQELQQILRGAYGGFFEAEPPLRVLRVPGSDAWPGWRWMVEATLRPSAAPGSPAFERAVGRMVDRALQAKVRNQAPSGVILRLHRAGAADEERNFDGRGMAVRAPGLADPFPPPGPTPAPRAPPR